MTKFSDMKHKEAKKRAKARDAERKERTGVVPDRDSPIKKARKQSAKKVTKKAAELAEVAEETPSDDS